MGPSAAARIGYKRRALRLVQARGQSAVARTDLGSCSLGNCTFGKLPLGKIPLGKYLTSFSRGRGGGIKLILPCFAICASNK